MDIPGDILPPSGYNDLMRWARDMTDALNALRLQAGEQAPDVPLAARTAAQKRDAQVYLAPIAAPDAESVRAHVTQEVYPIIRELLWRDSQGGLPLIRSRSVAS